MTPHTEFNGALETLFSIPIFGDGIVRIRVLTPESSAWHVLIMSPTRTGCGIDWP